MTIFAQLDEGQLFLWQSRGADSVLCRKTGGLSYEDVEGVAAWERVEIPAAMQGRAVITKPEPKAPRYRLTNTGRLLMRTADDLPMIECLDGDRALMQRIADLLNQHGEG